MASIPQRSIGDHTFSAIGFGAMGLSPTYGQVDMSEANDPNRLAVLDAAFNSGCTFWDTADVYGLGDNERLVGKWFAKNPDKRSQVFLSSKCGGRINESTGGFFIDGSPAYVRQAFAKSMENLGPAVGVLDMYYLHRPDVNTPIEKSVGVFAELVKAGKIRHIGLSECSADTIRRAHAVHPISAVQVEYSPFTLDIEDSKIKVLQTARELGIKIVAYSPLGRGLLTGAYTSPHQFAEDDFRRFIPKFSKENFPNVLALSDELKNIGKEHGATSGQATLAWILAQGDDFIPIPGTKNIKYLNENLGALKISLTKEDLLKVRDAARKLDLAEGGAGSGGQGKLGRYPPGLQEQLYAETPAL